MTWDGDPNKHIALDDTEGLALYRKIGDFSAYTKQRKLLAADNGRHLPYYERVKAAREKSIVAFEEQYPDFKEAYARQQER